MQSENNRSYITLVFLGRSIFLFSAFVDYTWNKHLIIPIDLGMVVVLVRATMFCLLCATHAHCSSHHSIENSHITSGLKASYDNGRENNDQFPPDSNKQLLSRLRKDSEEEDYIKLAFKIFGDGEKLSQEGFKNLLSAIGLKLSTGNSTFLKIKKDIKDDNRTTNNSKTVLDYSKDQCDSLDSILEDSKDVSAAMYGSLCPWILYHVIPTVYRGPSPCEQNEQMEIAQESNSVLVVWVYATVSVILISLCGLLAVAVIPLMQRTIYHSLVQFLVALAVGTLCGDALLHLLPHAMLTTHGAHDHPGSGMNESNHEEEHELNLWRGFTASLAVVFFYFTEKCLSLITEWRKRRQRKNKATTRVRVMREETRSNRDEENRVGEKLCKHKYSSYPYCYGEIANSTADNHTHNGPNADGEINSISHIREENGITKHDETDLQKEDAPCSEKQLLQSSGEQLPEYTVILREHETRHHGHAHTHGHVHSAPGSLSSVVWMIVMGDGLHNFADGLAIGTAFGANVGGGVSTAVAVFCHELPHEIGDFAVLLKAGMSAKQAVFYNFISSILCFIGMSFGVLLGHSETMKPWVFSFAAGMFLYIALVDMVPELSSSHSKEGSLCQCFVQLLGLMTGIGIMLLIALYEHDLMESFQHSF